MATDFLVVCSKKCQRLYFQYWIIVPHLDSHTDCHDDRNNVHSNRRLPCCMLEINKWMDNIFASITFDHVLLKKKTEINYRKLHFVVNNYFGCALTH
jgi:hypothetical protein